MRLPTTSFSRSRLRVSTSGSSGTGAHLFVRPGLRAVTSRRQRSPGLGGRRLLGLLLRPTLARAALLLVDVDGGVEALGVVGPVLADLVVGQGVEALGGQLLEASLVVLPAGAGGGGGNAVLEQAQDELARRVPAAVEVHGADDGLHGIREDRRLLPSARRILALAQGQARADAQF